MATLVFNTWFNTYSGNDKTRRSSAGGVEENDRGAQTNGYLWPISGRAAEQAR